MNLTSIIVKVLWRISYELDPSIIRYNIQKENIQPMIDIIYIKKFIL